MATGAADVSIATTSAGRVPVRDTGGQGVPVLLVHSLLVDADLYLALVPLLVARGYRCLVPELPLGAHGVPLEPDADVTPSGLARLVVEVLDALGVARAHVVGVDTGGAVTQILMARHRDRVGLHVVRGVGTVVVCLLRVQFVGPFLHVDALLVVACVLVVGEETHGRGS